MATIQKRVSARTGKVTYRTQVRIRGHPACSATFKRKTDAKRWAQQTEFSIRDGRYFRSDLHRKFTVADMIDRYVADILPRKTRSAHTQVHQYRWWRDRIGSYLLSDVTPSILAKCRDELAREEVPGGQLRSRATVNRYLAAISHSFNTAMNEWEWLPNNPVEPLGKLKEPTGRIRFLEPEELKKLMVACAESKSKYLNPIVVLALATGMRRGEILSLTWNQVDLDRGSVTLQRTKNDQFRAIPLTGHARDLIGQLHNEDARRDDLLFPGKSKKAPVDIKGPWITALKRAEIEDFRFHDLRHTAASYLAMNGATTSEIAEVLGHKTLQMVMRYTHLSEAHTTEVVERMNRKLFSDV